MITPRRDPEILLRRYWENPDTPVVTAGLSALSVGYRMALAMRERAYRWRLLGTGRLACPVISVGNITLGGSGKTPMVELVALALRELGANPAVVSRGYGRQTRGVHVVADRHGVQLGPRAAGDEPVLLAERLPGIPVVVGENRLDAGRTAVERCGADAIVLDDGFQHRTVHKDLEILVMNGRAPWGNARLFPRGMLREPLAALGRADLLVVSNPGDGTDVQSATRTIRRHNDRAPVLVGAYEVVEVREPDGERRAGAGELGGRRLLAFAGLGSPGTFAETLSAAGARLTGLVEYPDHHWFTEADLGELARQAKAAGAEALITSEKDWVRCRALQPPSIPVLVLVVRLRIDAGRDVLLQTLGRTLAGTSAGR
ncbi:MAG TPA: tetraacyldisaccharide 4'-kinase [Methylomirabilota bacterium]|jgi:tetraacyldisaccharide 4'-kinase|nr:tetraacyldisaccharide 4'-kinase [Methylomirabilota bacterium]